MDTYKKEFSRSSTDKLISGYLGYNSDYRKNAREELKRRKKLKELNMHLKLMGRKPVGKKKSTSAFGIKLPRF